jgi:glycosyltransferase involved in cell wall biosynthesis
LKKSVLLVCYFFAPQNAVGAVRPTKLAKYLTRAGYEVTVLCGAGMSAVKDPLLARDLQELKDVHVVRERSLLRFWKERGLKPETPETLAQRERLAQTGSPNTAATAQPVVSTSRTATQATQPATTTARPAAQPGKQRGRKLLDALYLWLSDRSDAAFARACVRELQAVGKRYDVVISTYGPASVHRVALKARRMRLAGRWIADFRDEVTVHFAWQRGSLARYVRSVRRHADAITAASAGYLRVMGLEKFGHVIYNGFDPEDLQGLAVPSKRTDRLTFIHCGQMYGAQRDLRPFFRAVRELIDEGAADAEKIALCYAGRDTGGFVSQATDAGLAACLKGYGFLPRDEALKLQKSSHILLLAAWNDRKRQGNVPGKLLEYLMLGMPVLCCVSGDQKGSEAAAILRRTGAGVCCEQSGGEADYAAMKAWVRAQYDRFIEGEPMQYSPDAEAIETFESRGMADAFARIIDGV